MMRFVEGAQSQPTGWADTSDTWLKKGWSYRVCSVASLWLCVSGVVLVLVLVCVGVCVRLCCVVSCVSLCSVATHAHENYGCDWVW